MDTIAELVYTSKDQDVQLRALAVMEVGDRITYPT
jgi:hypothetical protein